MDEKDKSSYIDLADQFKTFISYMVEPKTSFFLKKIIIESLDINIGFKMCPFIWLSLNLLVCGVGLLSAPLVWTRWVSVLFLVNMINT